MTLGRVGAIAGAGFAIGQLEKSDMWQKLPSPPLIGKKGLVLLALHYLSPGTGMWHDAEVTLAALVGYELGKDGTISGDGDSAFR